MAIVQIKSTNPQFTFLIKKNPQSGMAVKSIRKGLAYGWYTDEQAFNIYFKDADNEISYKQDESEQFEYLNVSRYNTPLFPLNAINEFLSAPFKARHEKDSEGYEHSFYINMIHIELPRYIELFARHMPDFVFDIQHRAHKSYSLTVSTGRSLYELLHTVSVLCLFLSAFGKEYIDVSDSILEKYMKSVNVIDAPFYIRSLFVRHFLSTRERFRKYKEQLENTERYDIHFDFGGTALQRRNYIGGQLAFDKSILDVGCGEGFYAIPFAPKLEGNYYAIDIDEEALEAVERKAKAKDIDNIVTYASIERFLETYNGEKVDIVMSEVVEHMSEDEAKRIILLICANVEFDQMIVTTPNRDFNTFYELDGFRHDDHKWEMNRQQFGQWIAGITEEAGLACEFAAIGDGVNSIRTTQGVILKRRGA